MIEEIIAFNQDFVQKGNYEPFATSKYPDKRVAIVSCMDTRLTELLPAALGIKNGDVKIIKNAGGLISHPFGSAVRSLLIAIFELGVEEVMIIGHTDCGVQSINSEKMIAHMQSRGIAKQAIDMISYCGIDFESWLSGFDNVDAAVKKTVMMLRSHPLIPRDIAVRGFVMDSLTGALSEV